MEKIEIRPMTYSSTSSKDTAKLLGILEFNEKGDLLLGVKYGRDKYIYFYAAELLELLHEGIASLEAPLEKAS